MSMHPVEKACREIAKSNCAADVWRYRVEDWFIRRNTTGGTADQCHHDMQIMYGPEVEKNSIAPRIHDLKEALEPRLYPTGEKRQTRSGSPATVYVHRTFFKPVDASQQQLLF